MKWGNKVALLSTYHKSMFFVLEEDFARMRCSRIYEHQETGRTTVPRVLTAILVASADLQSAVFRQLVSARLQLVRFGPPCETPLCAGHSDDFPPSTKRVSLAVHILPEVHVINLKRPHCQVALKAMPVFTPPDPTDPAIFKA